MVFVVYFWKLFILHFVMQKNNILIFAIATLIIVNFLSCKSTKKDTYTAVNQSSLRYDDTTLFAENSPYLMPYNRIIDGAGESVNFGNPDLENHSLDLVMIPNTALVVVEDRYGVAVFDSKTHVLANRWSYDKTPQYKSNMSSFSGIKAVTVKDSVYIFWGAGGRETPNSYVMQAAWTGKEIKFIKAFTFKAEAPLRWLCPMK